MSQTHTCNQTCAGTVGRTVCEQISSVPAKAAGCSGCNSPWKVQGVKPADPHGGLPSVAKQFENRALLSGARGGGTDYTLVTTAGGGIKV